MKLLYFAWVRQAIGVSEETFDLPDDIRTVGALAERLRARGGGYASAFAEFGRLRAAVNQEHVPFDAPVGTNDEVAFFPPVTGG
ncbi:MAG TPA: molybdopterin converting factor subunit 1 [Rhizomicrobium sp.]|jgi:molybdopterin synthase sulfur carrier subunit|nr:molybdopterin converting factor subunit 1 [Rhizomicrobium sp.]